MVTEFQIISPIDGQIVRTIAYTTLEQLEQVLEASNQAQLKWANKPLVERIAVLRRGVEILLEKKVELAKELTILIGRPIQYSPGELDGFAFRANYLLDLAPSALESVLVEETIEHSLKIYKEPLGTILLIGAWNYPYLVIVNTLIPALAAGNAVIIKHAPQTAPIGENICTAFSKAGLFPGLLNFINLDNSETEKLVGNPSVAAVSLVGSVNAGRAVLRQAASRSDDFINVTLELGGCDAAYVRPDANLADAATGLAEGAFFNTGQSCCGIQRIFIHTKVYTQFSILFEEAAQKFKPGNPLDPKTILGPVVSAAAANHIHRLVEKDDQNCNRIVKISPASQEFASNVAFISPKIYFEPPPDSTIMSQEIFGPVVAVIPVTDDDEAITRINETPYGLTTSIWTSDMEFVEVNSHRFNVGTIFVNRCDYLRIILISITLIFII